MNCEQIYELLSARLDGALSAEDEARVQAHLDACPDCRRLYEAMASIEKKTAELAVPA
ncbi:MAG: zf-HC2 domain-containing protein, partial [Oscillospiraceae bacterium]|nr:zf-HC2 domain-containing protein [Oscillospiraceae bacterium]